MVNVEFIEGFAMKAQRDATVSRRPAAITQADVARAIRAASKQAGAAEVEIRSADGAGR